VDERAGAVENLVTGMFENVYSGKTVLVTGNTGFKGAWLTAWLLKLGAKVVGVAKDVPTQPSMFVALDLAKRIAHHEVDIRDGAGLADLVQDVRPDFLFHLAAQAIVSVSYADPVETISTNAIGTMNVLEALRRLARPCTAVLITSDKCYQNVEWVWGYRETDALGGRDVYSGSKGAAELIIRSYVASFLEGKQGPIRIGVGRAGNVIGGGDWARDRIVVDCMRAWSEHRPVEIRSPRATRPWQHVLEPLSGYLTLGMALATSGALHGEAFNFGPRSDQNRTVLDLISDLARAWDLAPDEAYRVASDTPFHEAGLLSLNCDKAQFHLRWVPNLEYAETVRFVSDWYYAFYKGKRETYALTLDQIAQYEARAQQRGRIWANA
jgi:CDP-glucose 4,6-dehydratase